MARTDRSLGTKVYSNKPRPVKPAPSPWPGRLVRLVLALSGIVLSATVLYFIVRSARGYLSWRGLA